MTHKNTEHAQPTGGDVTKTLQACRSIRGLNGSKFGCKHVKGQTSSSSQDHFFFSAFTTHSDHPEHPLSVPWPHTCSPSASLTSIQTHFRYLSRLMACLIVSLPASFLDLQQLVLQYLLKAVAIKVFTVQAISLSESRPEHNQHKQYLPLSELTPDLQLTPGWLPATSELESETQPQMVSNPLMEKKRVISLVNPWDKSDYIVDYFKLHLLASSAFQHDWDKEKLSSEDLTWFSGEADKSNVNLLIRNMKLNQPFSLWCRVWFICKVSVARQLICIAQFIHWCNLKYFTEWKQTKTH